MLRKTNISFCRTDQTHHKSINGKNTLYQNTSIIILTKTPSRSLSAK